MDCLTHKVRFLNMGKSICFQYALRVVNYLFWCVVDVQSKTDLNSYLSEIYALHLLVNKYDWCRFWNQFQKLLIVQFIFTSCSLCRKCPGDSHKKSERIFRMKWTIICFHNLRVPYFTCEKELNSVSGTIVKNICVYNIQVKQTKSFVSALSVWDVTRHSESWTGQWTNTIF